MRNIIALCNTYAQLIAVLQMKMTIFAEDKVSLILSDHSKNAKGVAEKLAKKDFFDEVLYLPTKELDELEGISVPLLSLVKKGIFGKYDLKDEPINTKSFDLFLYYNYGMSTLLVYTRLYENNREIKCGRFEEGIASYFNIDTIYNRKEMPKKFMLLQDMRSFLNKANIDERTDTFYCYYPKFHKGNLTPVQIPLIKPDQVEMREVLKFIFDINEKNLQYKQKYIFFAGIGSAESGELEVAKKVADMVGKENLLIKVHPRDTTGVFEKSGLLVDGNSAKPWEAIQLSKDFSKHVFLTVYSGTLLAVNLMLEDAPKSYFLFNLCNVEGNDVGKAMVECNKKIIEMSKGMIDNVFVVDSSLDEIINQ